MRWWVRLGEPPGQVLLGCASPHAIPAEEGVAQVLSIPKLEIATHALRHAALVRKRSTELAVTRLEDVRLDGFIILPLR
ncbi:hypothetical protein VTI28DRAFT_7265 [Corynascus sepedonium]